MKMYLLIKLENIDENHIKKHVKNYNLRGKRNLERAGLNWRQRSFECLITPM